MEQEFLPRENPTFQQLIQTIRWIREQQPIPEEGGVLICYRLNTEEKIRKFLRWVESRTSGETLNAEMMEITRAATQIGKGLEPETELK